MQWIRRSHLLLDSRHVARILTYVMRHCWFGHQLPSEEAFLATHACTCIYSNVQFAVLQTSLLIAFLRAWVVYVIRGERNIEDLKVASNLPML